MPDRVLRLVGALLVLVACQSSSPPAPRTPDVAVGRQADLDALVAAVDSIHAEPFGVLNEASWRQDVASARERAASMSDDEFLVTVARLANLGDRSGHGGVFPTDQATLRMWPLGLYAFADGWYVVDALDRSLVGARVEGVGDRTIEQVADWVAPMVPRDNAGSLRARLPQYVVVPAFLRGSGLPDGPLRVVDARGVRRAVTPALVTPAEYARLAGIDVPQVPLALPRPSYAPREDLWWLHRHGDAMVIGYERVLAEMQDGRRMRRFVEVVREEVAKRRPRVVVVDLRRNPGGENSAGVPMTTLLRELATERRIPVRVLISRSTYSAAVTTLAPLRSVVRFYGEATGGSSTTYDDAAAQTLAHSGIVVHVPSGTSSALPAPIPAIEPHVRVEVTWRDWSAKRDAVLAAALR